MRHSGSDKQTLESHPGMKEKNLIMAYSGWVVSRKYLIPENNPS